jgi:ParB-like chromosome segregation protein Spo0J
VDKIASSIKNFGVLKNIVIDDKNEVVAGHGSLLAYQKLGVGVIPCVRASHLSPAQIKAFRIADNKTAESEWFPETLALELQALQEMDFDLSLTGFDKEELDRLLEVIPDVEFKEYDESVEKEVEYLECPECHHKWPK